MRVTRTLGWLVFIWVAVVLLPSTAFAGPLRLRVEVLNGSNWEGVVISDNAIGDGVALPGILSYSGMVGTGLFTVTTGISTVLTNPVETAELDLNSINIQFAGAGTVRLTLEDSSITSGSGTGGMRTALSNIGGTLNSGATVHAQTWVNPLNAAPALGPDQPTTGLLPALGAPPAGSVAILDAFYNTPVFGGSSFANFVDSGPYSLFSTVTINFANGGVVSFDLDTLVPVPEPGTMLLFGTGLIGAARMARRRLNASRGSEIAAA